MDPGSPALGWYLLSLSLKVRDSHPELSDPKCAPTLKWYAWECSPQQCALNIRWSAWECSPKQCAPTLKSCARERSPQQGCSELQGPVFSSVFAVRTEFLGVLPLQGTPYHVGFVLGSACFYQ